MEGLVVLLLSSALVVLAQTPAGVQLPLAEDCSGDGSIVCVNKYAAVLPYPFFRNVSANDFELDLYNTTVETESTGFDLIADADFVVYNRELGLEYLGSDPSYEFVFEVSSAVHEAPVYAPVQNLLFISQLAPPTGVLPQLVVNLNVDPPTLEEYVPKSTLRAGSAPKMATH
jgi:hypothetical protein